MEMVVQNAHFEVEFTFPGEYSKIGEPFDRRQRIHRHHFRDKPAIYSDWPD